MNLIDRKDYTGMSSEAILAHHQLDDAATIGALKADREALLAVVCAYEREYDEDDGATTFLEWEAVCPPEHRERVRSLVMDAQMRAADQTKPVDEGEGA